MSVIGTIVFKFICVTLTQSLVTRCRIFPDSMVFLGLGFTEKKKRELVRSVIPQVGGNLKWWRGLLYWAVVTSKLALRIVLGEKIKSQTCPQPLGRDITVCSQLQQREKAWGEDLNYTAVLVTENIFLQGPSRPLVVLQGRIRGNLITAMESSVPVGPSYICLWQELCACVLAGNQFGRMKVSPWEQQRSKCNWRPWDMQVIKLHSRFCSCLELLNAWEKA